MDYDLVGYCNGVLCSWTTVWTGHLGSFKSAGFYFGTPKDRMRDGEDGGSQ